MKLKEQINNKLSMGLLPTPIDLMPRLSEYYGSNIFFKRDDQTGSSLSGNKIRKLDYLLYDAERKGADTIITCGALQSNHSRATAIAARRRGFEPHLVLKGEMPSSFDGNLLLDKLLDSKIHILSPEEETTYDQKMEEVAEQLRKEGKKPYIIPLGGSNELGYLGYYRAGVEIQEQEKEMGIVYDYIFCAVGSGGTLGGLYLAKLANEWERRIIGVNVVDTAEKFQEEIKEVLDQLIEFYELETKITREEIEFQDGFVGPGYGISTPEVINLIKMVAQKEGIFLDPVYTGKTYWAMDHLLKSGKIPKGSNVLFMHTGGIYSLFPHKELFSD
ncbi:MAG: 1-aminocyclopropane-1-carboxylate deaminase/D-cysteine desulfhydrase [Candidatus Kariarchaeaceae archaeon]